MNRHSIFFKLNLLFATALIVTLIAGGLLYRQLEHRDRMALLLKSRLILQELRRDGRLSETLLQTLDLERVPPARAARFLPRNGRQTNLRGHKRRYGRRLIRHGGEVYLLIRTPQKHLLLHARQNTFRRYLLPGLLLGAILLILSLSYWALRRTLSPMRRLEEDIRRYGRGEPLRYAERFRSGEDEISRIARAFYDSAERLKRYGEARRLFLRNLLHELNTPVTKGKLLAELSHEPRTRRMLGTIFQRLSILLGELVEVERIAAGSEPFAEREELNVKELALEACRRLYCEAEEVGMEIPEELTLFADREAMVIVIKNLLDNARKYGRDPRIGVEGGRLVIRSHGAPLKRPLEHYTEPFRQEYAEPKEEGFGLGLYIVREILERHGMALGYRHENGENLFTVGPLNREG